MATDFHREPAKIIAFPSSGRGGAGRFTARQMSAEEFASQRIMPVEYGSGWYHDAAIAEDRNDD